MRDTNTSNSPPTTEPIGFVFSRITQVISLAAYEVASQTFEDEVTE